MNDRGPFDRMLDRGGPARDNSSRMILVILGVVGVILLVLVLPPVKLLGGGGDDATSGAAAKPPEGFEVLSKEYRPEKPKEAGPYNLTLKLLQATNDNRNLGIYAYNGGKWERLASASLSPEGTTAMGQVSTIPSRLYVLRRVTGAVQVAGVLPGGNQPDGAAMPSRMCGVRTPKPGSTAPRPTVRPRRILKRLQARSTPTWCGRAAGCRSDQAVGQPSSFRTNR